MPESHTDTENALATWSVDECAFEIQYALRVLDDIRLSVVDAFFSLPRGGAEIGGILLGKFSGSILTISDFAPLDCEHATGPSFVLSQNDQSRLAEMLASARGNPGGLEPVGWYHSHTRSEINLTPADLDIHKRYFPQPWQVALVLKPHAFQPCRAGFFFKERDGEIHSTGSYQEIKLEPMTPRPAADPVPSASSPVLRRPQEPAPVAAPLPKPHFEPRVPEPRPEPHPPEPRPIETRTVEPRPVEARIAEPRVLEPPPERKPEPRIAEPRGSIRRTELPYFPAPDPPEEVEDAPAPVPAAIPIEPEAVTVIAPPSFTQPEPSRSWGSAGIILALAIGLAFGATAYQTRDYWLPHGSAKAPYVGLSIQDNGGQLQIRWDRESPAVRGADDASLVIEDGSNGPQAVQLNSTHLRQGSFTYGRQSERVDVTLTLHGPASQTLREVATYLGKLPASAPPVQAPAPQAPAPDDPRKENKDLRGRNKKLEKTVDDLRQELRKEQKRSRLTNQSPESVK